MSIGLLVVALLLGVISLITTIGLQVVEKRIRMAEGNAIDSVLYTTQKGLHAWFEGWRFRSESLVADPALQRHTEALLKVPSASAETLAKTSALAAIRKHLSRHSQQYGDLGFF